MTREVQAPRAQMLRCDVTGNLVGTDTRRVGGPDCACNGCRAYRLGQLLSSLGGVAEDKAE